MADMTASNGTSALQTEYETPDQHDLAQAKPAVLSPNAAPSTDPSLDPTQVPVPPTAPESSLNTLAASTIEPPLERQSQSRSMSRASSSSASSGPEIVTDTGDQSTEQAPVSNGNVSSLPSQVPVVADSSNHLHPESVVPGEATDVPPSNLPDATADLLDAVTPRDSPVPQNAQIKSPQPVTSIPNLPKARLPHDTLGLLEDRIKDDPRGDTEAWLSLIEEHKKRGKYDEARAVYKRFLDLFPTAAEVWLSWAQMEIETNNRHGTDNVLSECLMKVPYLPLWSLYLDHVRRHNPLTTDASGAARQTIHQAYELALRQVGIDKDSGKMWQDYIAFIKSGPGIVGGSNWQDQQKMDQLRKLYQQAICIPTQATNALWKEYDSFEMGLNKTTGRKFMQDQSPAYMSARSSYTALQNLTTGLKRTTLASLPPADGFEGDTDYKTQLEIWKKWAQWEKSDPLVLQQDDLETYKARVVFVYRHALMTMRFWPELWCEASEFCLENGLDEFGQEFLKSGSAANPESCLLAFKEGDRLELTTPNEDDDAKHERRAAAVRAPYDKVLDSLYDLFNKGKDRERVVIGRIEAQYAEAQTNGVQEAKEDDEEKAAEDVARDQQKMAQIAAVQNIQAAQGRLLSRTISNVWIVLMRAMRRIQGIGEPQRKGETPGWGARGVFADARKRGRNTPELYVQAALLEFHLYDQSIPKKLFDRGLKLFADDEGFALEYIKYLVAINDHTNARVVFETVVARLTRNPETASKAKVLYHFFHGFESKYGELSQIIKLEKRMHDLFPDDPKLSSFESRYQNNNFNPTEVRPIISPARQMRPKNIPLIQAVIEQAPTPQIRAASPKRPLPIDDAEAEVGRPPKLQRIQRTDSPMKPVSQPMVKSNSNQASQQQFRPPIPQPPYPLPPLPRDITYLLSIIPRPDAYTATRFDPNKLVGLIRDTHVPNHINQLPQNGAARQAPPAPPPVQHVPQHMTGPPQPYSQPGSVPPMQHRPGLPPMPMQQQMPPQLGYPQYAQPPPVHYGYGR